MPSCFRPGGRGRHRFAVRNHIVARVLFCWELGGGYGHISNFLKLGRELRARGHEVVFALKDLARAENLLGRHGFALLQAPLWLPQPVGVPPPGNYGEILFSFGYFDAAGLTGVVRAWRSLYALVGADLFVMENSPTALLAARGLETPRALIGTGFSCPPRESPLPPLRWWQRDVKYRFDEHDRILLTTMNDVMRRVGAPELRQVADLLAAEETFLCTFSEIDHYLIRDPGQRYWGAASNVDEGAPPSWPVGDGSRVFAYLDPGHRDFATVLQALGRSGRSILVHAPGASERVRKSIAGPRLSFSASAVRVADALDSADGVVCHGGHGLVSASLLAGRPVLAVPTHLEQYMLAERLAMLGAGRSWVRERGEAALRKAIEEVLGKPDCRAAAAGFAESHRDFDPHGQAAGIVDRMEALLRPPGGVGTRA